MSPVVHPEIPGGELSAGELVVNDRAALRLYAEAGGMSPGERARVVARRLNALSEQQPLRAGELGTRRVGGLHAVTARGRVLVTATPADAAGLNLDPARTARLWRLNLADVLAGREVPDAALRGDREELGGTPSAASVPRTELETKIVPILTFGSNLNVGVAQVQGERRDVRRVVAVAQLETDYCDWARVKILVPVQSENVIQNIDRVPGVAVHAIVDYTVRK